ncbi:MAG: amino acid adenylation domain-containing protein, partial [Niastella sp.]|uniref:amino acid adenylation domain-containing protein n=1 Tax=Niastella sp. TaxID=1869183 RepID=UPI00389A3D25
MNEQLDKENVQDIFELNMIQKGMLFHHLNEVTGNLYNVQLALLFEGTLQTEVFIEAFRIVQSKNESLRSVFRWNEVSRPIQIVLKQCPAAILVHDYSAYDRTESAAMVEDFINKDQQERFDLTQLPVRMAIIRTAPASYIIVLSHHHILYDGWSTAIMLEELFSAYSQLTSNQEVDIVDKPSYKIIRQAVKRNEAAEKDSGYWREYLKDYEITSLFPERHGSSEPFAIKRMEFQAPKERLEEFASTHKVTKATIIYAAYGLLLQQYGNMPDIVFGTTVSDRSAAIRGHDRVMGNFINTIPLRITASGDKTLLEVVSALNEELLVRNQLTSTSYAGIKNMLGLKVSDDLFDCLIVIENYPLGEQLIKSLSTFNIKIKSVYGNAGIPLVATVFFGEELIFELSYMDNIISDDFAASFGKRLVKLTEEILSNPNRKAASVSLLSDEEENWLTNEFNATKTGYALDETVLTLFNNQADRTPEKTAIITGGKSISYRELQEISSRMASYLETVAGVKPGEGVGIMLEREEMLVPSILGVLATGAAYIPIDPEYPPHRVRNIIDSSGLKVLITRSKQAEGITVLDLDHCTGDILRQSPALLTRKASSNNVAYVIYTSGSTGTPKGCAITHRNLSNYLQWANAYYFGENEYGNCGLITSISFDLTVTCLFVPLIKGRKLFIGDGGKDIAGLLKDCFGNPEIDTIKLTPSHISLLQGLNITNTNVRVIICGGEQLTKEQLNIVWNINKDIRIYNEYGPTETTVGSIVLEMKPDDKKILIGRPIANTEIYILQEDDRLTPTEMTGEICIAGAGVGNGYWGQPVLTSEKFVGNPFKPGEKMYRTGDLGRLLSNGYIECLGRKDDQVKIRGFRIELQEIEAQLSEFEGIRQVRVIVRQKDGDKYIVAYYLSDNEYNGAVLKDYLLKKVPAYMIPAFFVRLESIPVNSNGKLDRKLLPEPQIPSDGDYLDVAGDVEAAILQIWLEVLGHDRISTNVNFFDIGGDSLKLISVYSKVKSSFDVDMQFTDLFDYPTITALADFIKSGMPQDKVPQQENAGVFDTGVMQAASTAPVSTNTDLSPVRDQDIAIIGMAGRFPGAATIAEFWENLKAGIDSITVDKKEADPATLVRAKAHLREYDAFDAAFFNYIPSEAANMDPQLRIFHECVWEAFEDAGYRPGNYAGSIGLYGGASPNPCYNINIDDNDKEGWLEKWEVMSYADKDFMCPRVSYKLNLKGPSINVTTACSTSLVAVAMACNDLLANNCDMAAAGGVSVTMHDNDGYLYRKDMILSPDGRCRAFDEDAAGTVGGNGAGVVVLKRYADAIRDGDHINAVIKGTAINNDGNQKVGFTAPGIEGQSRVIDAAIRSAGISAESISYIETHGTATLLGDPIEVAGLMKAFNTDKRQFCAIGSVKSNIGHLDAAAGIAGLIKAVLSLKHKLIPPSLHFKKANPHIDFANSPFYVNTQPSYWKNGQYPRRAGVSSFGIGGTNAHVILEEVLVNDSISHDSYQLITLSAKTPAALSGNRAKLLNYLRKPGEASLADIAFTLQVGREPFKYRDTFVCSTREEAIGLLSTRSDDAVPQMAPAHQPDVVFMFSGQGAQYAHMYRGIYDNQKYFRDTADECFAIVNRIARIDLKAIIFPGPDGADQLKSTAYTQPALFIMEYALAKLLSHWGIRPDIMIGHSIGEYVAACLSGVFSLEDALKLVTTRGALMQSMPKGSMLAIAARQQELIPLLDEHSGISLAAINSPAHCVVSGPSGSIALFAEVLKAHGWEHRELHTSHAFHSSMMDEILSSFEEVVSAVTFFPINIPFISNYTGKRALDKEVSTPAYWVQHLRREVRFAEGMETILKKGPALLVELGPGNALATFVRASDAFGKEHTVINMVRHSKQDTDDMKWLLKGIGEMWMLDIQPDWIAWHQEENRKRVPLPTYSFEKTPFPATIQKTARVNEMENNRVIERNPDISKWLYVPGWRTTPNLAAIRKNSSVDPAYSGFLIFSDGQPFSARLIEKLTSTNTSFALVVNGTTYQEAPDNCYILDADSDNDYNKLFDSLSQKAFKYDNIVYIRTTPGDPAFITSRLAQIVRSAYGNGSLPRKQIVLLTAGLHNVLGDEPVSPSLAPVSGLLKVIPQEYSGVYTSHIDISAKEAQRDYAVREIDADAFLNKLLDEIGHREQGKSVALRNSKRWVPVFEWLFEQPGSASVLHDLPVK